MAPDELAGTIEELLAVTPEPPPLDSDPDLVAEEAEAMLAARAPLCLRLITLSSEERVVPATHTARYASLLDRNARWAACLSTARRTLSQRMTGARRLRRGY